MTRSNVHTWAYFSWIVVGYHDSSIPRFVSQSNSPDSPICFEPIFNLVKITSCQQSDKLLLVVVDLRIGRHLVEALQTLKISPDLNRDVPRMSYRECCAVRSCVGARHYRISYTLNDDPNTVRQ